MPVTVELNEEFVDRLDQHREEGETREEFLTEVLDHFEVEGRFLREGYAGEP